MPTRRVGLENIVVLRKHGEPVVQPSAAAPGAVTEASHQPSVPELEARITPRNNKPAPTQPALTIQWIPTQPKISTQLAAPPLPVQCETLNDDELLATLSKTGRSASLVTTGGRTRLICQ